MGLLEDLKQHAEQRRNELQQQSLREHEKEGRFRNVLIPKIREMHDYLRELVEYLQLADLPVQVAYDIPHYQTILTDQQAYRIKLSDIANPVWFKLDFFCIKPEPLKFDVMPRENAEQTAEFLRNANISFVEYPIRGSNRSINGLTFELSFKVPVSFQFEADRESGKIQIVSKNFEGFALKRDRVAPESMDERWKDRFGNYLIRRIHAYHYHPLSLEERETIKSSIRQIQRALDEDI